MSIIEYISVVMVIIGAGFLFRSLMPAGKILVYVSDSLCRRWKIIIILMRFFLLGYLFFIMILTLKLPIPMELVTAAIFLGGAVFVLLIMNIFKTTILAQREAERKLWELNSTLEQKVYERTQELQQSTDFSRIIFDSVVDPISIIDIETYNIVAANKVFLEEAGLSEQQVIGKTCYEITHNRTTPCEAPHDLCPLEDCLKSGDHAKTEHTHFIKNGEPRIVEVLTSPIMDSNGKIVQVVHIQRDITERKITEEQIRSLAYYDSITGLPNRTFHCELLVREIAFAKRNNIAMATMFIDLDGFKKINDSLGHDIGDDLLRQSAGRLSLCLRECDCIARSNEEIPAKNVVSRLGGDEFIVLLNEVAHMNDAAIVARRLLKVFEEPFNLKGNQVYISASIGIALYPVDGNTVEELLKCADIAMYHTKEHGKNNYSFFSSSMNHTAVERLTLENYMRQALINEEFLLHYQPKINVKTRKITGMEALVRWHHPERGMISPLDFISIAEETGLIANLGQWVLRTACEQNKKWQDSGMEPVPVAVNLSLHQLKKGDIVDMIREVLENTGLAASYLELEITESTAMYNPAYIIGIMKELQSMRVKISIDDFGTGYSSLAYLRQLPLDSIKIDRSFVQAITAKPDDAAIVSAIIAMAHNLNLKVIAEGVETEDQYAFLQSLDCDEIQGFLFSKPVTSEEFSRLPFWQERQSCKSTMVP